VTVFDNLVSNNFQDNIKTDQLTLLYIKHDSKLTLPVIKQTLWEWNDIAPEIIHNEIWHYLASRNNIWVWHFPSSFTVEFI